VIRVECHDARHVLPWTNVDPNTIDVLGFIGLPDHVHVIGSRYQARDNKVISVKGDSTQWRSEQECCLPRCAFLVHGLGFVSRPARCGRDGGNHSSIQTSLSP
jgi:hypothetical protein